MNVLDQPCVNFIKSCYMISGILLIISLVYICQSKNHRITVPLILIYLLEIFSQCCASTTFFISNPNAPLPSPRINYLWAGAFTAHWISVSIFTGEYIKVSTQTPLLLDKSTLQWCPMAMNVLVLIVLGFCFYGYIFVTQAAAFLVWIVFTGKTFLAFSMLSVQVLSVTKIKRMILAI